MGSGCILVCVQETRFYDLNVNFYHLDFGVVPRVSEGDSIEFFGGLEGMMRSCRW